MEEAIHPQLIHSSSLSCNGNFHVFWVLMIQHTSRKIRDCLYSIQCFADYHIKKYEMYITYVYTLVSNLSKLSRGRHAQLYNSSKQFTDSKKEVQF